MEDRKNILSKPAVAYSLTVFIWMAWGSCFPLIKKSYGLFGIQGIASPLMFGGIRFIIAGFVLLLVMTIKSGHFPVLSKTQLKKLLILGTVQTGCTYFFEYIALNYASGTNSSIINAIQPLFLMIFSSIFFKTDKITVRKLLGIAIGFAGVLICLMDGSSLHFTLLGEGFIFISALFFCLGSNVAKVITSGVDPTVTAGYNLLIGGVEIFIIGTLSGGKLTNGGPQGFAILGILSLISACCFMLWTALCTANPVSKLAPLQFVNPLTGAILSGIILGENILRFKYLAAIVLVCAGILIATTGSNAAKTVKD